MKSIIKKYELGRIEIAFIIIILIAAIIAGVYAWKSGRDKQTDINSFADCVAAGYPVMEKYPEECNADGKHFTNPDQQVEQMDTDQPPVTHETTEQALVSYCADQGASDAAVVTPRVKAALGNTEITVEKGDFARTKLACAEGGEERVVFLNKIDDKWQVLADSSTEAIDCALLDNTEIPAEITSTCTDENGQVKDI